MFCPKCKSILQPTKNALVCSCGYKQSVQNYNEKLPKERDIEVRDSKNLSAVYKHTCTKCGYEFAEIITKGIFYGDEDENIQYKCGKCGFVQDIEGQRVK